MKTFLLRNPKRILAIAGLASICGLFGTASAQYTGRIYATAQNWGTAGLGSKTVTNPANALATTSLQNYSTPKITVGVAGTTVRQYLEFHNSDNSLMTIPTGTVVHIKVGVSAGLLGIDAAGLLGNTTVGSFKGLSGSQGSATATLSTSKVSTSGGNTLLTLLSGAGTDEIEYTTTEPSNGVYLELKAPLLGVAYSGDLFHAYIYGDVATSPGCPKTIDWTYSTATSPLASTVGDLSTITHPEYAVDQDPTTAATLNPINVLNTTVFNLTLNTPAEVGDSIRILLNNPNAGLLDLAALHGMVIKAYDGPNQVGANIDENSSLLTLKLFPQSTTISEITAAVVPTGGQASTTFDRISIQIGGVANVSSLLGNGSINIYGADVVVPAPQLKDDEADQYAYANTSVNLNSYVNANGTDGIVWYDAAEGGNIVTSPVTLTANKTYYAASERNGCSDASARTALNMKIATINSSDLSNGNVGQPYTGKLDITVATNPNLPQTPIYKLQNITGVFTSGTVKSNSSKYDIFNRYAMAAIPVVYAAGPLSSMCTSAFAAIPIDNGLDIDADGNVTGTPIAEGSLQIEADVFDQANNLQAGHISKTLVIGAALPVQLSNFDVNLDADKNAVLTWTTQSEQGSIRFDVLRSNDGINFAVIGSKEAAGISTKAIDYSFKDPNPGAKSYYKLNIVKNDGIKTSNMISITGGRVAGFSINPNPASNDITITGLSDIKSVSIYDASGRLVQTATSNHINVRNLSQGIYFVTVVTNDGNKVNSKFIKK